ncbi:hypothetical protein GCM10010912_65910 [Paenibacillus albidus]|uniref:Uncharacterized protein n=1 Tax=Paenibacillus albidus TaxID=2041023 RepID=A0A917FXG3_9BACL|nr:hypothetical protein [Paenibacillus albidus]GGG12281.1 hypothetical protein GCM10010912_65910 [Paenibacillus albidus]
MDSLDQALKQFISIRMEYTASSLLYHSNEYKQLIEECNQRFTDLEAYLPLAGKQLLQDYDTNSMLLQGIAETLMYKQGLKDGLRLHQMLENE